MRPEIARILERNAERIFAIAHALEDEGRAIEYLHVGEERLHLLPARIAAAPQIDQHRHRRVGGAGIGRIRERDLAFVFRIEQIGPGLRSLVRRQRLRVLQDDEQVQVVPDPEIVGVAIFGGYGVDILRRIGREISPVRFQERAGDAPDDVALRPVLLGLYALDDHAGAGRYHVDLNTGLLAEGRGGELVERAFVRCIDNKLLLRMRDSGHGQRRARQGENGELAESIDGHRCLRAHRLRRARQVPQGSCVEHAAAAAAGARAWWYVARGRAPVSRSTAAGARIRADRRPWTAPDSYGRYCPRFRAARSHPAHSPGCARARPCP